MIPSELREHLVTTLPNHIKTLVVGTPGIGKTDIGIQVTNELGWDLLLTQPTVDDPVDWKGFPAPTGDGRATFLPYGNLEVLTSATRPTLCIFDDLGHATDAVQKAIMHPLLQREINGQPVSKHVRFLACTNSRTDKAGVKGLLEPLKSRFHCIITLVPDAEDWKVWAIKNNMPFELIAFVNMRPKFLTEGFIPSRDMVQSPVPRTIAHLGELMLCGAVRKRSVGNLKTYDHPLNVEIVEGAIGTSFATEFIGFLDTWHKLGALPQQITQDPDGAPIPTESDKIFALAGALSNSADEDKNWKQFMHYAERVRTEASKPEFQMVFITDAITRDPVLAQTPEYSKWAIANPNLV